MGSRIQEPDLDNDQSLKEILEVKSIETLQDIDKTFIPEHLFRNDVFTAERIQQILETPDQNGDRDLDGDISYIQNNAKRLLAILLQFQDDPDALRRAIRAFVDGRITDTDLPFNRYPLDGKNFGLCSRHHATGHQHPCLMMILNEDRKATRDICRLQWSVQAAIFEKGVAPHNEVKHYIFNNSIMLPFINDPKNDPKIIYEGGFGRVWPVRIAAGHQNLLQSNFPEWSPLIAVKELKESDANEFQRETEMLKSRYIRADLHVIDLLATYFQNGRYYLLFPWAPKNLRTLWESVEMPHWNLDTYRWSLDQMTGLSGALERIHEHQSSLAFSSKVEHSRLIRTRVVQIQLNQSERQKTFGRHGDIKPENILWRNDVSDPGGLLQVADLGLSSFHRFESRSGIDPSTVSCSPTYSPPEIELNIPISRAYDLWSLGCVLLEFVVWTVQGKKGLDDFKTKRFQKAWDGVYDDTYYTIVKDNPPPYAIVRPSVIKYIGELRANYRCSDALRGVLKIIEEKLLVTNPEARIKPGPLEQELRRLRNGSGVFMVGFNPTDEGRGICMPSG